MVSTQLRELCLENAHIAEALLWLSDRGLGGRAKELRYPSRWRRDILAGMETPEKRRWYCPTPGWLVLGSMAVTGLLFASEKWRWFGFNEHKGWTVLIAVAA